MCGAFSSIGGVVVEKSFNKEEPVVDRLIFIFLQTKFDNMYCCRESILDRYVMCAKNDKIITFVINRILFFP